MLYPAELPGRLFVYQTKAMSRISTLIQVFAKNPVPGKVKTRLIPLLGEKKACELHAELVASVMKRLETLTGMIQIWIDEEPISPFFTRFKVEKRLQAGRDIGQRMGHAMTFGLSESNRVILIGSDLPEIDQTYIDQTIKLLGKYDYIFGPAEDGGFGLIAGNQFDSRLFTDVSWGGAKVLSTLIRNTKALSKTYALLPSIWDVDGPGDYVRYKKWIADSRKK